jgi:protein-tyrosine kinase
MKLKMTMEQEPTLNQRESQQGDGAPRPRGELVRLIKSIAINPDKGKTIDEKVVRFKFYNAFNYSLLSRDQQETLPLTLGVVSPKPREGKTLVACNLAVSLALSSQKKTILVDLNAANPRLHEVFGVAMAPGMSEALMNGTIHVSETAVHNLYVLAAGNFPQLVEGNAGMSGGVRKGSGMMFGLDLLPALRDVIYSLEQEYDFVIVDLPAINTADVPVLFTSQLNGLLVVVDSGRTRRDDLDEMFRHVNESKVLGFVFNRFDSDQI